MKPFPVAVYGYQDHIKISAQHSVFKIKALSSAKIEEIFIIFKIEILEKCSLFRGTKAEDIGNLLKNLHAADRKYPKGSFVLRQGDVTDSLGILTEGALRIVTEDFAGNRNIISEIEPGELFAEVFASVKGAVISVDVEAEADSRVIWIKVREILENGGEKLVTSLLGVIAGKNLMLNRKIEHLSRRSTREKLLSYLTYEMRRKGSRTFDIPFDRQGLADYLSVDRSAMSAELSRMKRDGLIDYRKSRFTLYGEGE